MSRLAAIIPAAGLSSRMGAAFKPLLPLAGGTVVSRCVEVFRANGVEHVLVVTGKRASEVAEAARKAGAEPVHNADFEQGMYSSVLTGVQALAGDVSAFFMLPVDMPLVRNETVDRLLQEFQRTEPSVLYPRFRGERGHPPIIGRELIPDILTHDGRGGLRVVLDRHEGGARDLDVADFGTVHDIDHPADYGLACSLAGTEYPCEAECRQLWEMQSVQEHIIGHCRAVAKVAEALCEHLNARRGVPLLDSGLVRGAALTHDIGKGTKRHEAAGAELLHLHGFHAAADIVAAHFDLTLRPEEPISEKEIVFLADKLVRCHAPVSLEARYMEKLKMYAHETGATEAILGRLGRARDVLVRFDREMNVPAEQLAREALA
ncbi:MULTISPECIES: DVU_1551 family NTP transferase [unclassified Pseudodesulfovibrio]|uniref:DVU_1551 family NTP transferase n=1 Tax=unclassified Pseudodesulfovibrio TaxID=2661612 RepID=UPI000FEB8CF2|nr:MULTISPECIES: NTP transferase domain-containing protein [unclassified Pseudodesulfovibrio]MCJ2164779.1 NTP transferase domain-containing protein [Pseudodesulfovibrio sp. S3-i]RWU04037.1 HD domain-containing protein [Pseudodesulfovibrio sp. S3]